jgi:hypothetical protein
VLLFAIAIIILYIFIFLFYLSLFFLSHRFSLYFFELSQITDAERDVLVDFLFTLLPDFMEIVEIDLTNKGRVVAMFKVLWEYFFCKSSYIFYSDRSFLFAVSNNLLIWFALVIDQ